MFTLGYANQTDHSTLSGGSWNSSYPLSNLKSRYLTERARTTSDLATASIIDLDLITAQRIGVVALIRHNLTTSATIRILGSATSDHASPLYDSGNLAVYDHEDWATTFAITEARYWRIAITDTTNPDNYIEIGRAFVGWKFQPTHNMDWKPSLGVESKTGVAESMGGQEYFDDRANRRIWRGQLSWLGHAEAYRMLHGMFRQMDISGEVFFMEDDLDVDFRDVRWFLGRFRQLSEIEWPYLSQHSTAIEIGEIL